MAKRFVWMAALAGMGVACAGGEFVGGSGGAGSGGISASGGSSGSGGTGGTATGGSSGGGSGGASTGGAGGTGGSGAFCPVSAPLPGSACPKLGHICHYPARCCDDEYECSIDGWVYNRCVGTTAVATCPSAAPVAGTSCDTCVDQPECLYVSCAEGVSHAYCDSDAWTVSQTPCVTASCYWGSEGFASQFVKDCVSDADCETASVYYDCYTTLLVVAVHTADAQRLRNAWASCLTTSSLSVCSNTPGLPHDESGATASDPALIVAKCLAGTCTSAATP